MDLNRNSDMEFPSLPGSESTFSLSIWPRLNKRQPPPEWELVDLTKVNSELIESQSPPEPLPQPSFFLFQELQPQSFENLPNLEPISQMPPIQPKLTAEPGVTLPWTSQEPYRFVNIEVPAYPGHDKTYPYIVSIPVPVSEFVPIVDELAPPTPKSSSSNAEPETVPSPAPSSQLKGNGKRETEGDKKRGGRGRKGQTSGAGNGGRRGGSRGVGPAKNCALCKNNKLPKKVVTSHNLYDQNGKVECPVLRKQVCKLCGATGDNAHTWKHCPEGQQQKSDVRKAK